MASPRRKADSQEAPQTTEEAADMITAYLDALAQIEQLKLDADAAIDQIRAARDGAVKPLEELAKGMFLSLRSWWAVEKQELTDGRRKSIALAGAEIGDRTTPPRLVHQGLKAEDVIGRLRSARKRQFLRITFALDKPALIKALRLGDAMTRALEKIGLGVAQREEFFIDRAEPEAADPETVETDDPEIREAAR